MADRPPTVLVTGGTGFVGTAFSDLLVRRGWDVVVVTRPTSGPPPAGTRALVHGSDPSAFRAELERLRPAACVHLAAYFAAIHQESEVAELVATNVTFGAQLLEALPRGTPVVTVGTGWQHYEDAEYEPVNLYAATKQAFLDIARWYVQARDYRLLAVEILDTYGPGDRRRKVLDRIHGAAVSGVTLEMSGGEQYLDLVYVEDVAAALHRALEVATSVAPGLHRFRVTSGAPLRLRDVVATYERATHRGVPVVWGRLPYRPREILKPLRWGDRLPGWQPAVSLEAGLRRTYGTGTR